MNEDNRRIGVFLCECGGNISDAIALGEVTKSLEDIKDERIVSIETDEHLCSLQGQERIQESVKRNGLDAVVVCACSPQIHEKLFQKCLSDIGSNPYLLEIANIREGCAWCTPKSKATEKSILLVRSAIEAAKRLVPLENMKLRSMKRAVVLGGGIAGMTTALSLARQGIRVHLLEKRSSIGGNMVRVGKVFSPDKLAEECALCSISPMMNEIASNRNISLYPLAMMAEVGGSAGNFKAVIEHGPHYIDSDKCISCGKCSTVCPVTVPDWWNANMKMRKAVYRPFPQAVPNHFTIDVDHCTKCGECVRVCRTGAIDLRKRVRRNTVSTGAIIIATGHKEYDASKKYEYGYGRFKDVITQTELARITAVNGPTLGRLVRPSDGRPPRRVVMVQCVGSRDEKPNAHAYCSKVCCMVALKHANYIKYYFPYTDVVICYTDMRALGRYEHYFRKSQENGVRFIRGKPGDIFESKDGLTVRLEDTLNKEIVELGADMVVLSEALEPSDGSVEYANLLGVSLNDDMFVKEKHPKLNPVETDVEGIFVCGTAQGPKDITESVLQAGAATSNVLELLKGDVQRSPFNAEISKEKCDNCGACVSVCRYKAIVNRESGDAKSKADFGEERPSRGDGRGRQDKEEGYEINQYACVGCGGCVAACRQGAILLAGWSDDRIMGAISGLLAEKMKGEQRGASGKEREEGGKAGRRIIAFLEGQIAYVSADNAGANRMEYGSEFLIVRVPSTARLTAPLIVEAFRKGADGVFFGEGAENGPMGRMFDFAQENFAEIRAEVGKAGFNPRRMFFARVYAPHFRGLIDRFNQFSKTLDEIDGISRQ